MLRTDTAEISSAVNVPQIAVVCKGYNCPVSFKFAIGEDGKPETETRTLTRDGTSISEKTMEDYIIDAVEKGVDAGLKQIGIFNSGAECSTYLGCPVTLSPDVPFKVPYKDGIIFIPKIELSLALKISQSRVTVDRAKNYQFAVALDDLVTGITATASRLSNAATTEIVEVEKSAPEKDSVKGEPLQNGTIFRVVIKGYFPYEEMSGLMPVPIETVRRPFFYKPPDAS